MSLAAAYMHDEITIRREREGAEGDIWGNKPYDDHQAKANVDESQKRIRTSTGEEKISLASFITTFAVRVTDLVHLPGAPVETFLPILKLNPVKGIGSAVSHYEVYL